MRIPYFMLADALIAIGKAGLKGGKVAATRVAWPIFKGVTYGLSQAAFDININRLDSWLTQDGDGDGTGKNFPLTEFEVTIDNPDGTDNEIVVPVKLEWKEESDAVIYSFFLMSGTMMYWSFVRYYWGQMKTFKQAAQSATIAGNTAEAAIQAEKAQDLQTLIKSKQDSIIRMKGFAQDIDMADNLKGVYSNVWVALEGQVDDLANFDKLPKSKQAQYLKEIEIQKNANISAAEDAASKAKKASKSNYGKFVKTGLGVIDIGLFIGTGLLSLIIDDESEQDILETIFGEDTVEKYNLTMPLGISDFLLAVVLTEIFIYFGDDLEEVGIPATPETLLAFALSFMGDYWKIVVDAPILNFDLTEYFDTKVEDLGIGSKLFFKGLDSLRTDEELLYEILGLIIGVFSLRVIWVTYGGLLMKAIGSGSPAAA